MTMKGIISNTSSHERLFLRVSVIIVRLPGGSLLQIAVFIKLSTTINSNSSINNSNTLLIDYYTMLWGMSMFLFV
jgi:hypothetical protein